ncbi:hypothetical protein Tco_0719328 [Tanacetum coccineum]
MGSKIEKEVMKRSGFDLQQESSEPVEEEIVYQDDVIAEQAVKESSRTTGGRRKKSLARKRAKETLGEEKVQLMREKHRSNKIKLVHGVGVLEETGVAVCTRVGITSEEEDASETFSRIGMPKNGSLFMCDGASWSTVAEEGKPVDAGEFWYATMSAIRANDFWLGDQQLEWRYSNSSNIG